ncbi:MAG: 4-hydroxy-3-methylbut-2-enyl diphosphate reductase [Oxalobacter sp.]|nr:MAG: 4-hydroxy-3-methylbut-2-enyl diphosphate reductase [Oxalobacter sp.]
MDKTILLAQPRGFCAGVHRAIEIVERTIEQFGAPIYVRHEIVHNAYVVSGLRQKGAIFVSELDEVPPGSTVIFSAHGVSQAVRAQAEARQLRVFDATCPLVMKVHMEVARMDQEGREIIMIGHRGHPEVEGTMGQLDGGIHLVQTPADVDSLQVSDPNNLAYVTQTTLSLDDSAEVIAALKQRFPNIIEPKRADICYATTNRQMAVKALAPQVDMVIVVGSPNSSNSNRLREVAEKTGTFARMVDNASQIDPAWLIEKKRIGLTAGASAPEVLVQEVIARLKDFGIENVQIMAGVEEKIAFPLPGGLRA